MHSRIAQLIILLGFRLSLMTTAHSFKATDALSPKHASVVYSLATWSYPRAPDDMRMNYNIVTYAHQMSIQPARWALSLYKGTQSSRNMFDYRNGVLQVLPDDFNTDAISLLGKRSSVDDEVDKIHELDLLGIERISVSIGSDRPSIFSKALSLIALEIDYTQPIIDLGDHELVICIPTFLTGDAQVPPLTTQSLRDRGII